MLDDCYAVYDFQGSSPLDLTWVHTASSPSVGLHGHGVGNYNVCSLNHCIITRMSSIEHR